MSDPGNNHICRVYPRTCGGTRSTSPVRRWSWGLSPHVRGNLLATCWSASIPGSIPARAGEPRPGRLYGRWSKVYPRTCGGTEPGCGTGRGSAGLSPHVRGNLRGVEVGGPGPGSIPARAGEPRPSAASCSATGVYPRTCGGTRQASGRRSACSGLSPHVRGNPLAMRAEKSSLGSIPARAGEPDSAWGFPPLHRVYPRTCGGTRPRQPRRAGHEGLSPHVRGNRDDGLHQGVREGSIPARAGEP